MDLALHALWSRAVSIVAGLVTLALMIGFVVVATVLISYLQDEDVSL